MPNRQTKLRLGHEDTMFATDSIWVLPMEFEDIFEEFAHAVTVPKAAIKACLKDPEISTDHTIEIIEMIIKNNNLMDGRVSYDEQTSLIIFLHVLGELKEKRVFAPLLRLLACDEDIVDEVFGDHLTESIPQILISTYDGDSDKLLVLIDDQDADAFCRDAALRTWAYLAATGVIPKQDAEKYLLSSFGKLKAKFEVETWASWIEAVTVTGSSDLSPLVKELLDDQRMIDENYTSYEYFSQELEERLNTTDLEEFLRGKFLHPIGSTVEELSKWYSFSEDYRRDERRKEMAESNVDTVVNFHKNIGRNDPCFCGSGKKYKKCCLH